MKKIIFATLFLAGFTTQAQVADTTSKLSKTKDLQGVKVSSKKPFIEQQIDKTVINVQNDVLAVGSTAFEILQKAPGLSITGEDVINMSGKAGVNVMIDGRPTQMSSKELANYLRSIPGSSIEKIELITNPSARFDAQGNAGIINIRLKKNKVKGTNGNVGIGYTQNVHFRSNGNFNINHRSGKVNLFANSSVNHNNQHTNGYITRNVTIGNTTRVFNNNTIDQDRNTSYDIRTGADYYLNKKSTFGILFNANANRSPFKTPGQTLISSNGIVDSSLNTQNDNLYRNKRYNVNGNYRYEDTLGNELNVDADYTWFNNTNTTNLATSFLDKNNLEYNRTANNLDVATNIRIYAIKADYAKQIKAIKGKIETGVKMSKVVTSNDLYATVLANNMMKPDTGRSNLFDYNENVYAAYFNIGSSIKKWEYQVGVRAEYSQVNGKSTDLAKQVINNPDTNYLNLFPSAFVSYALNGQNKLAITYSRRINRPDYQSLNPFETIYDIYTVEKGNPFLRPQYTNNFELKYSYKYALNLALGYNHTSDYSQTITSQTGQLTRATTSNIGSLDNLYLNISSPLPINKWWSGYVNITGFMNHYKGQLPDGILNKKVLGMNYYIQQNFNLGKSWDLQVSSWYNAPTTEAIFKTSALGSLDLGIKKSFAQNKYTFRVVMNDLLNTQRWKQSVQFGNMDFTYNRKWESRGIRFQFSWKFGKTNYNARERETNKDGERIKVKS